MQIHYLHDRRTEHKKTKMAMLVVMIMAMAMGLLVPLTQEHGLMIEPPARNAMWRVGFNTTPNYEDTEMFCGGISVSCAQSFLFCLTADQPEPMEDQQRQVRHLW